MYRETPAQGSDLEADFRLLDRLSRRLRDGTLSAEPTIDPEAGESSNDQHDLEKYCNALAYRITRKVRGTGQMPKLAVGDR
eukprot:scaffold2739_cov257-Pinguiococcus_pyrenoidosus.AAC.23